MNNEYQQRVRNELLELSDKLNKLSNFIDNSAVYHQLSIEEQDFLDEQRLAMIYYKDCLDMRISFFK